MNATILVLPTPTALTKSKRPKWRKRPPRAHDDNIFQVVHKLRANRGVITRINNNIIKSTSVINKTDCDTFQVVMRHFKRVHIVENTLSVILIRVGGGGANLL